MEAYIRRRVKANGDRSGVGNDGRAVKDQYFGDVNDFQKYSLLRSLERPGSLRVGVCWMLTAPDGRSDGGRIEYLGQPDRFRAHDPELFDWLRVAIAEDGDRRTARFELSSLLGDAVFQSRLLTDCREERETYFTECGALFRDCDLVYFDPDNGIERSTRPGQRGSAKYVYWSEIRAAFEAGASVVIYQHFPREDRRLFTARLAGELRRHTGAERVCTWPTRQVVFVGAFHARHVTFACTEQAS
jgi:hypothetical protein